MRLHLLALPHTQVSDSYTSCAYTQKVAKFCPMMGKDHEIILYAGEDVSGTSGYAEHVVCIEEQHRRKWFGHGFNTVKTPLVWQYSAPYWQHFGENAIPQLKKRCQPGDVVLLTSGADTQLPIANAVKGIAPSVEWAVGYEGVVADFAAFESYAWMHHVYGIKKWCNGRPWDWVIPNYFDPADFLPVNPNPEPYLLFLGRVTARKGPHIAAQIAEKLGMKLLVAGPGAFQSGRGGTIYGEGCELTGDVEYVGEVGKEDRAKLLRNAACLLAPTIYVEPFGGVAVEAMMAGCPVVASDWGAFTETVTANRGRRFRILSQGVQGVHEAMHLDRQVIAYEARIRYSLEAVRPRFNGWFNQLQCLWSGKGYYE